MRYLIVLSAAVFLFLGFFQMASAHEDMRQTAREVREKRQILVEKALAEKKAAREAAETARNEIFRDRAALEKAIEKIKKDNSLVQQSNDRLSSKIQAAVKEEQALEQELAEKDAVVKELVGFIRLNAGDLSAMLSSSLQSAFADKRFDLVDSLADKERFPGLADIKAMVEILKDEISRSSEVRIQQGKIIDQTGSEVEAEILVLGNFTAAYRKEKETGFLLYSETSHRLFALSKKPPFGMQKKINEYMDGKTMDVPVDMSRGGAMRQLTHKLSLVEQIPRGGAVVWPILMIVVIAGLIIVERFVFLARKNINAPAFMEELKQRMLNNDFKGCAALCDKYGKKPLARAVKAGLAFRDRGRADMENALQEAILREIPPLEKFLSTLGMLAAIAPLLGLLGTVTGMINTFHVITFHGTSDPRMMSGGISEALVTTMLGLSAAIPIMLCHTIISRKVETMISTMEEKAVSFVNTIFLVKSSRP